MQRDLVQFQTPPPPLDQDQEGPIKTTSRQNSSSRKKKRATGLRIDYARDANAHSLSFDADDVIIANGTDSLPESSPSSVSVSVPVQSQPKPEVEPEAEPKAEAEPQSDEAEATPELWLDQSKALITEKLSSARQLVASVSSARKDAIARRRMAADNLNMASGDYASLEKQLEEACEAEDFETAERLSDCLAAAYEKRQALLARERNNLFVRKRKLLRTNWRNFLLRSLLRSSPPIKTLKNPNHQNSQIKHKTQKN